MLISTYGPYLFYPPVYSLPLVLLIHPVLNPPFPAY